MKIIAVAAKPAAADAEKAEAADIMVEMGEAASAAKASKMLIVAATITGRLIAAAGVHRHGGVQA